jgi:mono/diheme cytochrome c family protein
MEKKYINMYKTITLISALIFVITTILMFYAEVISPEWKQNQDAFKNYIADNKTAADIPRISLGLKQIEISEFNHIDRCNTCHLDIENTQSEKVDLPFSGHPGQLLEIHDLSSFGCTLCHSGMGRSLLRDETCNPEKIIDWRPVKSNCANCHLSIFKHSPDSKLPLVINEAKSAVYGLGCLGCHKIRHVGGQLGPDLTDLGNKIRQGYNFKNVEGKHSIYNWHIEHFTNPDRITPGTIMPDFNLDYDKTMALSTLVLGLSKPVLPFRYYDLDVLGEYKNKRNQLKPEETYSLLCSACHGEKGKGRSYQDNIFGVPGISNIDFQAVASMDMINFIIQEGRSKRYMQSWKIRHSGLEIAELTALTRLIRDFRPAAPTFAQVMLMTNDIALGKRLYNNHCSSCHGPKKTGGIGPSLNSDSFLSLSSDEFLYTTIIRGRANTAMPSWSRFNSTEIYSLIRELQPFRRRIDQNKITNIIPARVVKGRDVYHYNCSRCHGEEGNGGIGPAILKNDFLQSASDTFIKGTIKSGRSHTPMFSALGDEDKIIDLLHFMRQREDRVENVIAPGPVLGNPASGKALFQRFCAECHGNDGEGIKAPALHNQEFLNAATNGYLLATITLGREKTPMPEWGKTKDKRRALSSKERYDLVAFIRQWQSITIKRESSDPIYNLLSTKK